MSKRERLRGLYGITDSKLLPDINALKLAVEQALQGGMRICQYRAKNLTANERRQQAEAIQLLCRQYEATFIINDDVALAQSLQADGVHIGRDDLSLVQARQQLGDSFIIGCSCYDQLSLAREAQQQGADYVAMGRFFPSQTKPQAVQANPELLFEAKKELDIPLCAIGGITPENAPVVIGQGADMLAVIQGLFAVPSVLDQASSFTRLFQY